MDLIDKASVLNTLVRWRLSWKRRDLDHRPSGPYPPATMSARQATALIANDATVLSCGLAANARCSIFYWAVREQFEKTGTPSGLTWISVGAQGGRGRVPGTVEELALPGLVTCYISGHVETAKALLKMADRGDLELHLMPQGEMAHAIEAQGKGIDHVLSRTGIDTFLDPQCGGGSPVTFGESLVRRQGDRLEYRLPRIDVAIINAPYADASGNIYFRDAATMTESVEAARAAHYNGGRVLVAVSDLIEHAPDEVVLDHELVDALVVNPRNEQTGGIPQRRFWSLFTPQGTGDDLAAVRKLRFANDVLGLTPARGPAEQAIARLGAQLFTRVVSPGATVNLGVGYGEELVRVLCEQGLHRQVTFTTETGVYGGVPAPGIYFGSAVFPQRLESSAWMFHHYREKLDTTVLGFLEVDSEGNVNGSDRSGKILDLVGPGGMPSIVASARTIIFIGAWMQGARWKIHQGEIRLHQPGAAKFVDRVRSVTFNGRTALEDDKQVFYVTHVGIFRLTTEGLVLIAVMPGVDIEEHIMQGCPARIMLPSNGEVERISSAVLTGKNFSLDWQNQPAIRPGGQQ